MGSSIHIQLYVEGRTSLLNDGTLKLNWSAVYSKAYNETPDNAEIFLIGSHVASSGAATRRWEHNSDKDLAGYIDLSYKWKTGSNSVLDFLAGGMYRDKKRDSFLMNIHSTPLQVRVIRNISTKTGITLMKYSSRHVLTEISATR